MTSSTSPDGVSAHVPKSVLLVIDVQDSFKGDATTWATRNNPAFESNVAKLIEAYRNADLPIVFVLHQNLRPESHFNQQSPLYRFMDFVAPRPGEVVLQKTLDVIAERCGFGDVRHFRRLWTTTFGQSLSHFRKATANGHESEPRIDTN